MARKFQKLTKKKVAELAPSGSITEHGITAERLTDGDIRWKLQIMVDRSRVHRVVGRESEGVCRAQAEQLIEKLRTEAREGRLNLPPGRKTVPSFAEMARRYLEMQAKTGDKQIQRKRQQIEERLIPFFGRHPFDRVPNAEVEIFVATRRTEGAANSSINRELATLSHIYTRAVKWKWISPDKSIDIERQKESRGRVFALTLEQCDRLLSAAMKDQDPDIWLFVLLGLHTSMRHGELRRLRWDQLDAPLRRFHVPDAKAGQREQPLTTAVTAVLAREHERRGHPEGYVFQPGNNSTTLYRNTFRKAFRRSVIRAGLDPAIVTPHVMRHTAITQLVKANVDLPTIQSISGHKTLAMVIRYAHVHAVHVDEASDRLSMPVPNGMGDN